MLLLEYYACIVCWKTTDLKRCTRCQMISYCCSDHQKKHWPEHRNICNVISTMMKERGVSHLFEKLKGVDLETWREERSRIINEVQPRMVEETLKESRGLFSRELEYNEECLFKFPRSCYVCRESRQTLLKSCPGCPCAFFCEEHPSSLIHDEDCAKMKEAIEFQKLLPFNSNDAHKAIFSIINENNVFDASKLPISMNEVISKFPTCSTISAGMKIHLSDLFSPVLTVYKSLQVLKFSPGSELTIHAYTTVHCAHPWEILLHLFPNVKVLRIGLINFEFPMYKDSVLLCKDCKNKNKKMIVDSLELDEYFKDMALSSVLKNYNFQEPDVLIFCNLFVPVQFHFLRTFPTLTCPIILTTMHQNAHNILKKLVEVMLKFKVPIFDGPNMFNSLVNYRQDDRLACRNKYMLILTSKSKQETEITRNSFFAGICQVCGSSEAPLRCELCKMIFYCGESHQDEHKNLHKELCQTILEVLSQDEAPRLVDRLKIDDSNSWLKDKLILLSKVKLRLARELFDFEKQMFLFPKACFICHQSDSNILKRCECGIYLCEIHKSDPEHKNLCSNFSLVFKIANTEQAEIPKATVKIINLSRNCDAYVSMENFIDSFLSFEKKISEFEISKLEKFLISDFLTRPFTFLWCLEKLNFKEESLIVHVIGATDSEVSAQEYWKLILLHFQQLKSLKIIFIGPEISKPSSIQNGLEFPASMIFGRTLQVESHALKYEEYCQSESFIEPNFIIGFNLNFHESKLGIVDCDWKEMILTFRKINVPFILTAASKIRARKDHETLCELSGRIMNCFCYEKNPFAGLTPERDFETERLVFSNQYVIIYNELCEKKLSKLNISEENSESVPVSETKITEIATKSKNDSNHQNDKKTKQKKKKTSSGKRN